MTTELQNRLRSPVLWLAVASLISLVLKEWFGVEIPSYDAVVESVLGALVLFGVLNNPTNKTGF